MRQLTLKPTTISPHASTISNFLSTSFGIGQGAEPKPGAPLPERGPAFSLIGIYEVILANICELSQFNVHLFRELLGVCERIELGGLRYYFGFGSVFGDIPSAGTAMLLRASKAHKHGVSFRGHCGSRRAFKNRADHRSIFVPVERSRV